ncbi:MAG: methylmalonyl-CoA epimerase [Candidatus Thermoplasmatota archaeon]|nr:methylmalonyl-CoA epimerase [Candidatus Thermoplasmatota archaeon]
MSNGIERKKGINHIGIAVKSLKEAGERFSRIVGEGGHEEAVSGEGVKTLIFEEHRIELLEPVSEGSAIAKFIEKRGEGLHHIAITVDNIEKKVEELRAQGFVFTAEKPSIGAGGKKVIFIHPKSANGVLIELVEERE